MQGISSVGTLAAAKFACEESGLAIIEAELRQENIDYARELPSFELLLKATVEEGGTLGAVAFCEFKAHRDDFTIR